jgi:hypothetical protein
VLLSLAVAQLLLLMLLPAFYKRNRTKVALFNRILRLLLLTAAAVFAKPGLMDTMSKQHRSAANGSQHNSWLVFMRKVLGPPLVYMGHANHVLPFQWTLLMQLYMVAVCSVAVFRSSTCVLATSDSNAAMAATVCANAKHVVFYVSRAVGRLPYDTSLDAADACKGLAAILLLLLYTHVVLLLIVPGVVMFRIELSLKSEFVRLRGGCVPKVWQMLDSADAMLLLAYTLVVGAWCHHHHQITKLSHSINAIGPAPHRSGRKREHRSIVFATITIRSLVCVRSSGCMAAACGMQQYV